MQFTLQTRKFTVFPPTNWSKPEDHDDEPAESLKLHHVYGYRGKDCAENLFYTASGKVVYFTAAVGIVHDVNTNTQNFLIGHIDDITSMAIHPNKNIVATGQIDPKGKAEKAYFIVWDVVTCKQISICKNFHDQGINALAFTRDGDKIVSVGADNDHMVAVWDWKKGKILASTKGGTEKIWSVACSPYDDSFVTCGSKNISFWSIDEGDHLSRKKGIFGRKGELQNIMCAFFTEDGLVLSGTGKSGDVYVWRKSELVHVIPTVHKGPIYCIKKVPTGFVTAGKDGKLVIWKKDDTQPWTECLPASVIETPFEVKCVDANLVAETKTVLMGSASNQIVEWVLDQSYDKFSERIIQDPHFSETWGLATHPSELQMATASDDRSVKLWDLESRTLIGKTLVGDAARSVHYSPDASQLAVGLKDGSFVVLSLPDLGQILLRKDRKEEVSDLKYSPDGNLLAVTSHDNFIDIYDVHSNFKRVATCKGHSSFITHIDWSEDSRYIQSTSGDYELLFWEAESGTQMCDASDLRDMDWASYTCVLGWPVTGIWPPNSDGTDVNAVCRSKTGTLLAIGDDFGLVRLCRFPTLPLGKKGEMARNKQYIGHSSHVTNVRWTHEDSLLISDGGNDWSIFQWKLVAPQEE
mmetsp:Transcript_15033/g.25736  ORF Transcript_15033/g.25736 Transcript_15033/m.25736 type:complete len:637 (+) Transcript_15033:128-2038(+)